MKMSLQIHELEIIKTKLTPEESLSIKRRLLGLKESSDNRSLFITKKSALVLV